MSLLEQAICYVNRDRVLYANILEILRRESEELIYADSDGVLLYDKDSEVYMMSAQSTVLADWMLRKLPEKLEILVGFEQFYREEAKRRYGFKTEEICLS
ncbi:MAG: N-acetyltransferase, partial [Oscillospiraceae bacterium]